MALIICNECKQKVSDKASSCPHCGAPIKLEEIYNDEEKDIIMVRCNMIIVTIVCLFISIPLLPASIALCINTTYRLLTFIPFFVMFLISLVLFFDFKKCYIVLTNKRIYGKHFYWFRKTEIDYPLRQIKHITTIGLFGITSFTVSTGMQQYTIPFAVNGKKFKKEYFNLIENKYKY